VKEKEGPQKKSPLHKKRGKLKGLKPPKKVKEEVPRKLSPKYPRRPQLCKKAPK